MGSGGIRRRFALWLLGALWAGLAGADQPASVGPPDLAAYQGRVVYVDFWASWCVPCKQSFPWMNAMHRQYGKDGLVVIAVNMDQMREDADAFLKKYPAEFKVHFDPEGRLAPRFKVRGMPTSALLGRDGEVLLVHEGFKSKDAASLEQAIKQALQ
jgi:cytochrome c biogenesis protein CcmG/thiol:disulfide interchange protein DsbE